MRLLYKDQFRKIKLNKFNFISLSLLVIIISLSFTAVKSSVRRLEENYDSYLEEQQLEDFYFSMGKVDVNYLGGTATYKLCKELDLDLACALALANPNDHIGINNLNVLLNEKIEERPDLYESLVDSYVSEFEDGTEKQSAYCFSCSQSFQQTLLAKSSIAVELGLEPDSEGVTTKKEFTRKPKAARIKREEAREVVGYGSKGRGCRGIKDILKGITSNDQILCDIWLSIYKT